VLGLFVFLPIVYKSLWHTFVGRFEFYETVSFLSSLEVLLRTTDPYLWISNSKWRIFLTYLGISSKWHEFLLFRKPPNRRPPFSPIRSRVHTHFRSKWISTPNPRRSFIIWYQSSVSCTFDIGFRFSRLCFQNCSWCIRLLTVLVRSSGFCCFSSLVLVHHYVWIIFVALRLACFWIGEWSWLFIHSGTILWLSKWQCRNGRSVVFGGRELPQVVVLGSVVGF